MSRLRIASKKHPEIDPVDLSMMERAIELARSASGANEVPVGAVIYRGEEILAEAANNRETTGDPTGHAELVALRLAGERLGSWRLEGCSMAVTLEPCPMCAGALVNARLDRLVYGAFDRKAGACCSLFQIPEDRRLNHRVEMIGGVEEERCAELLRAFFRRRRAEKRQAG